MTRMTWTNKGILIQIWIMAKDYYFREVNEFRPRNTHDQADKETNSCHATCTMSDLDDDLFKGSSYSSEP